MSSSKGISQARIGHEVPLAMTQWRITAAIKSLSSPAMRPMAAMASSLSGDRHRAETRFDSSGIRQVETRRVIEAAKTLGFHLLYALLIVRLALRELVWVNVTAHPTADWIARVRLIAREPPLRAPAVGRQRFSEDFPQAVGQGSPGK
jgi:hypothetical protein